jgi:hypothetical protein
MTFIHTESTFELAIIDHLTSNGWAVLRICKKRSILLMVRNTGKKQCCSHVTTKLMWLKN